MKRTKTAKRIVSGLLGIAMTTSFILVAVNAYHAGREVSYSAAPSGSGLADTDRSSMASEGSGTSEGSAASEGGRGPAGGPGLDNSPFLHASDADLSIGTSERHMLYQSQETDAFRTPLPDSDNQSAADYNTADANSGSTQNNRKNMPDSSAGVQTDADGSNSSADRQTDADGSNSSADRQTNADSKSGRTDVQTDTDSKSGRTDAQMDADSKNSRADGQTDAAADKKSAGKKKKDGQASDSSRNTFQTVTADYFSDALFIGDSRTVGMFQSHLLPQATYYAKTGIGIGDILTERIVNEGGVMISVADALSRHSFGKVYIMIGINDIARGDVEWFTQQYRNILSTVRRTQPDAVIYIQGNIPMSYRTQDLDGALNNRNLSLRDQASQALTDSEHIFYLDISSIYADANGHLASDYTRDGLHVRTDDYPLWVDYLLQHAIVHT